MLILISTVFFGKIFAMLFTIITITLNAEKYLEQTLRSAAEQEGVLFEHLVWDGGSTDRTLEIVRSFPHVKLIQGKDKGIADAMNKAAAHAKGDFLHFLHADDLFADARTLLMIERYLNLHPEAEWLYGRARIIDENGHFIRTTPQEPFSFKRLRKYNFITHPATVVSRSLFNRVGGFQADLRYCMDYDFWLKAAKLSSPLTITNTLACFREHQNSLSTHEPLRVTDEAYAVRNRYVKSWAERFRSWRTWKKRRNSL